VYCILNRELVEAELLRDGLDVLVGQVGDVGLRPQEVAALLAKVGYAIEIVDLAPPLCRMTDRHQHAVTIREGGRSAGVLLGLCAGRRRWR
jgi:hypothetical protein